MTTEAFLVGLSDDITRFLRRDDIADLGVNRIVLADIRDRIDRLAGRSRWRVGDPPRPPVAVPENETLRHVTTPAGDRLAWLSREEADS
jgi:hypothetical protein